MRKDRYEPDFAIAATHPWYPGEKFVFHLPKRLPQGAVDAEKALHGLKDSETADAYRLALVNVVAELVTEEPEGFDDFPGAEQLKALREARDELAQEGLKEDRRGALEASVGELKAQLAGNRATPLAERMRVYFDEPDKPEFEAILLSVWRGYKAAAIPAAYVKSLPRDDAGSAGVSPPA